MNRLRLLCLTAISLAAWASPSPATPPDAGDESRALAAYMEAEYSAYLVDYIHVFLGYSTCAYEFIDEEVLNSLADDVLRAMTSRGVQLIRAQHAATPTMLSDDAVRYAASLAVLTAMEVWSNRVTAELAPLYEGQDFECGASVAENEARYRALQRFSIR